MHIREFTMNNRQNINRTYRPRNPRFSSQNRNQRPFIRPQAHHNQPRIHQRNQNEDKYNFSSTSTGNFADQSVADKNIHHGSMAMGSSFPVMQNNQLINQPRIRHPNPQTWQISSVPEPQFGTNVTSTNMQRSGTQRMPSIQPTHIAPGFHQQLDNSSVRKEMFTMSTPSFGNADFSNTIQPSMQNQHIDHNNFTLQPDNIIPQNVGDNNELYFPKAQDNQSQQVQIPGLDLCPDSTDQAPLIQEQHHPILKQGQESSMQNVEHTGLMNFPRQSEPMIDNRSRQQNYMGFQDIQTSQVERFQSPNLSSPMMSLPPPPMSFLHHHETQHDSITQPMNNRMPTPITPQNFQFERLPNSNMFPPLQGSAPMQQYPRQPSQLKTFTTEPRFQSVRQPYHDQSRGILTQYPPMQQNIKPPLQDNLKPRDYKTSPMTGKELDTQWINDWLIRKGKQKMKEEMPLQADTNVYEVQEKTKRMMFLMASLQKQIRLLSQCDRGQFDEEMRTASKLKKEMDSIKKYLSMVNKETLKIKVKRRTQKRERMRKQRQEKYFAKQRDLEKREQLHKDIDERLNKMYKANEDKRQEIELKKTADKILSEVRKKTQDVTRATDLLKNLKKLRKLRKDRLLQQGVHSKQETDVDFEDKIQDCLAVLTKQKEVYNAENRALRVMLETEQEENQEKEREKRKRILHSQELKKQKKENRLLFGDTEPCDINDPMFVFSQYYEQASLNLDSLIQIRHDWDRFCVSDTTPGGTRIPDGFVIPEKPSSNIWASSLKEET